MANTPVFSVSVNIRNVKGVASDLNKVVGLTQKTDKQLQGVGNAFSVMQVKAKRSLDTIVPKLKVMTNGLKGVAVSLANVVNKLNLIRLGILGIGAMAVAGIFSKMGGANRTLGEGANNLLDKETQSKIERTNKQLGYSLPANFSQVKSAMASNEVYSQLLGGAFGNDYTTKDRERFSDDKSNSVNSWVELYKKAVQTFDKMQKDFGREQALSMYSAKYGQDLQNILGLNTEQIASKNFRTGVSNWFDTFSKMTSSQGLDEREKMEDKLNQALTKLSDALMRLMNSFIPVIENVLVPAINALAPIIDKLSLALCALMVWLDEKGVSSKGKAGLDWLGSYASIYIAYGANYAGMMSDESKERMVKNANKRIAQSEAVFKDDEKQNQSPNIENINIAKETPVPINHQSPNIEKFDELESQIKGDVPTQKVEKQKELNTNLLQNKANNKANVYYGNDNFDKELNNSTGLLYGEEERQADALALKQQTKSDEFAKKENNSNVNVKNNFEVKVYSNDPYTKVEINNTNNQLMKNANKN